MTIENLRSAKSKVDLAKILKISPVFLTRVLYRSPIDDKYTRFEISKKNGGVREIFAPNKELKVLQKKLAEILYICLRSIREEQKSKNKSSYGFEKNKTIFDNAYRHKNKRNLLNLDLENFFDSFNFGRVRGFFIKNRYFNLSEEVATVIAQIACHENKLPQGSPCSPVITNLICNILDVRLRKLAIKNRCLYTRYADDITFSTNARFFTQDLVTNKANGVVRLGNKLIREIQRAGFNINSKKIHCSNRFQRQEVTGLIVNQKVGVKTEYHKNIRAMCYSLFKTGKFYYKDIKSGSFETGTLNKLEGFLSFVDYIDFKNNLIIKNQKSTKSPIEKNKRERLLSDFLFFKNFFGLTKATILTEGKTDIVYLEKAIKSRTNTFPNLFNSEAEEKSQIKFFHKGRRSKYFLGLNEGCGCFAKFISDYNKNYIFFKNLSKKTAKYPVIIVLDNDDAIKRIISTIKTVKKLTKEIDRTNTSWLHITDNLYLALVPYSKNNDTVIEDCFTKETLNISLDGKVFNKTNAKLSENEYGKNYFANHIGKYASDIDFSGFDGLLTNIQNCLIDYQNKYPLKVTPIFN